MDIILASLISCAEAQKIIEKIYSNQHLDNESKIGLYESFRGSAPDGCLADTPPEP